MSPASPAPTTTAQTTAVIAEKPSVARDIARVLGATRRGDGFLHGDGWVVTWALGHLVTLAQPHEIEPRWKRWRRDALPMLPERWPLVVADETRRQYDVVRRVLTSPKVGTVVCATDAGREGELIFRYIYEAAGSDKPVRRLWISSLTPAAIRAGFAGLRDGRDFDPLADAARGRSQADWLVGMNLSRAVTLAHGGDGEVLSVGRVQTPTLAMVVARELAIRDFVPEDYLEVTATFALPGDADDAAAPAATYAGTWYRSAGPADKPTAAARRLAADGEEAKRIVARARRGKATVESLARETKRWPPPLLYDLTELQRHANRLFGWSAKKTLGVAQRLYEEKKLLTYPRTDSRHLSRDVAATLPEVVAAIAAPYRELLAPGTGELPLGHRYVDDAKVSDHHAIIPTATRADEVRLGADERRLYDLVCRRLLAAWHDDHVVATTTATTALAAEEAGATVVDRYRSTGKTVLEAGWKVLDLGDGRRRKRQAAGDDDRAGGEDEQALPAALAEELAVGVAEARALLKTTRPPKRFTEATLLTAMETAGEALDDRELSRAMKERGLGTPATRAEIIETLLRRGYLERQGKSLAATERGIRLVDRVHERVKSPAMTGEWEAELERIRRRETDLATFMARIAAYVREVVGETLDGAAGNGQGETAGQATLPVATPAPGTATASAPPADDGYDYGPPPWVGAAGDGAGEPADELEADKPGVHGDERAAAPRPARRERPPTPPEEVAKLLRDPFRLERFRPFQEETCREVTAGRDVLLVMPTGAGKSLCYQLPGLARGGTTLVVSPLIALMEDQVQKLAALGLAAERIHSGRDRGASRRVCDDYLAGRLDYLFIAPERLAVPGFPEMLARRKPTLVAIDEAHCISHWGHDFRPEYRLLGERLPILRPAPVIALTATATPQVQVDIVHQLGLGAPRRHIHGFRRTNLAIEVAETPPSAREERVAAVLADAERRPAIVYAPTRKQAERLGEILAAEFPAAAYHAGRTPAHRDRVQAAFLAGELEVVVATIAFGMGVDKADIRTVFHTGLPGSLEAYYQEIGRAGRDGLPSRAILLYSWADRRTHEFFFERDYPEPATMDRVFAALDATPRPVDALARSAHVDEETVEKALEKLWIHGGAQVVGGDRFRRGQDGWRAPYEAQREHKTGQLADMTRFAEAHGCRMLHLVEHFGDQADDGRPCGVCDVCAPDDNLVRRYRAPSPAERTVAFRAVATLRERRGLSTGRLFQEASADGMVDRRGFERVLGALAEAGLVVVDDDSFEKNGRTIRFQRAALTREGYRDGAVDDAELRLLAPPRKAKAGGKAPARRSGKAGSKRKSKAPRADAPPALVEALKEWRLQEARRRRIPAFRIMPNRTLEAVAAMRPGDATSLLAVPGMGPTLVEKYGERILEIVGAG